MNVGMYAKMYNIELERVCVYACLGRHIRRFKKEKEKGYVNNEWRSVHWLNEVGCLISSHSCTLTSNIEFGYTRPSERAQSLVPKLKSGGGSHKPSTFGSLGWGILLRACNVQRKGGGVQTDACVHNYLFFLNSI